MSVHLAAAEVVAEANAVWGLELSLEFRCPAGAEGVYAVDLGGARYALRFWRTPASHRVVFEGIHRRLDHLRGQGVAVPALFRAGQVGEHFVEIAEWVEGSAPAATSEGLVAGALRVLEIMRGNALEPGRAWARWLLTSVDDDAVNFCRPGGLLEAGSSGRAVLSKAQTMMRQLAEEDLTAEDIVHCDFGLGNVLIAQERIVAVVDWSGCRDGSGCFDLIGLKWELDVYRQAHDLTSPVDDAIATFSSADRVASTCHYAVRHAAASIGRRDEDDVFNRALEALSALS